jgi:hypothetical protein
MSKPDHTSCWAEKLTAAMEIAGDAGPVIHCTLSDAQMQIRFDDGFGGVEGRPFTAWTPKRVYFPTDYDGAENVASAPRDPCSEATVHVGSGGGRWYGDEDTKAGEGQ